VRGQGRDRLIPTAAPSSTAASAERHWRVPRIRTRYRAAGALVVTVAAFTALAFVLAGRRGQFSTAILTAPVWLLLVAAVLHLTSLVTRSEAWNLCVRAAGGSTPRRVVFRAAGVGALASVLSASLGAATRIGALRRTAPSTCPRLPVLVTAEVPIVAVEVMLAALFTFTLVGPLQLPAWAPVVVVVGTAAAVVGLRQLARAHRSGFWRGLAAAREFRGRGRLVTLVVLGVVAQVARNWLLLHAVGVHDASILDAIAVLIVSVSLSAFPVGAGVGAAATVLILGAHGVADSAAAGVLLTVTGTVGGLCYATWACGDHMLAMARSRRAALI
jgi:uncharacterized membrane protein YbhN (UPF0104 family)